MSSFPQPILNEPLSTQNFQSLYTFGPGMHENPYHINVVRQPLNRNLSRCFPDLHNEFVQAFGDILALKEHGNQASLGQPMRFTVLIRVEIGARRQTIDHAGHLSSEQPYLCRSSLMWVQ